MLFSRIIQKLVNRHYVIYDIEKIIKVIAR